MITNITQPFNDEIFYSWFGRYHLLSGNINSSETDINLFNKNTYKKSINYPHNLNYLCSQLPIALNISTDSIINNNTCFPFFKCFLKTQFSNYLVDIMKYGSTTPENNTKKICNLFNDRIIKICPKCINEDRKINHFSYIHRIHQIPGIFICPHHIIPLEYIDLSKTKYSTNYFIFDNIINYRTPYKIDCTIYEELFKLQSDICKLIKSDISNYSIEKIISKYKQKLILKNYSSLSGTINYNKLTTDFFNYYPQNLLDFLKLDLNKNTTRYPLSNLIRNIDTKFNPIKHLLFIKFLFDDIESFINDPEEFLPFGNGPWPCLNIASDHYKKDIITSYKLRKSTADNSLYGIFKCNCGFIYTRSLPKKNKKNKFTIKAVLNRGEAWENKATNLINSENHSIRQLGEILNCSTGKILTYAIKNKLLHHLNTSVEYKNIKDKFEYNENLLNQYKQRISDFIGENKDMSRKEISKILTQECKVVLKNDKEWYDNIMPQKLKPCNNNFVDWHKRDLETSKLVKKTIKYLKENTDLRLTKQNISKKTGLRFIIEYRPLSKMPITRKIIESSSETRDEYLKRKVCFIIKNSHESKDKLTPKIVISQLHLTKKIDSNLCEFIQSSINKHFII